MNILKKTITLILFVCLGTVYAFSQQETSIKRSISGIVKDVEDNPLIGATVIIKNQPGLGVTTDINGKFEISANSYDVLIISYIGFHDLEVPIKERTFIQDIVLKEQAEKIEEVVIVGGNTVQRKLTQTGAISAVAPEILKGISSGNLTNALAGNVPGIIAQQLSGEPGKNFSEFWVRGIGTFGANASALVLVDGIERNLNEINVEDIESFSVLKDASATAIYGQRGANGVILVTTKRGKEGKVNIDVKAEYSVIGHVKMPEYIDGVSYAELLNEALVTRGRDPKYSAQEIEIFRYSLDPDLYPNVNWRDYVMKDTSPSYKGSLNISGGGSTARYFISGSYYREEGMYKTRDYNTYNTNINYQRYNYRANVDVNITKSTIIELGIGGWMALNNGPTSGSNSIWNSLVSTTPVAVPIVYSNGYVPTYGTGELLNPDAVINRVGYSQGTESKMETNVSLKQNLDFLTKGLNFTGRFAFDTYSTQNITRSKRPNLYHAEPQRDSNGELILRRVSNSSPLSQSSTNTGNKRMYVEANLSYERLFADKHRVSGLLMYYQEELANSSDVGTDLKQGVPNRHMALSGRVTYGLLDRYLIEANFGYTGSENFEKSRRFGFFPAISAGWVLSEEPFMKEKFGSWLEIFKLRASYGQVGNDGLSERFPFISSIVSSNGFAFGQQGSGAVGGYRLNNWGARQLTWEVATKYDIGIDMSLWNGMFTLTTDIFKDDRRKIFLQRNNLPLLIGADFNNPWANIGQMTSHGFDGNLAFMKKIGKVDVTLRGNWTYAVNEVLDYDEAANALFYQKTEGYRWNQVRGYISEGLFKDQEDIKNSPKQTFGSYMPGDIKYKDVNGDGIINKEDKVPLGYTNSPNLTYGFGASVQWNSFDINILFQGSGKSSFFMNGYTRAFSGGDNGNVLKQVASLDHRWVSHEMSGTYDTENMNAVFPRLSYASMPNNEQDSDYWLRSSRYLRLKTLEVGYTFSQKLARKLFMKRARVYFLGNNLAIFSPFKWWDVESANGSGANYPINKTFTMGLQLAF